jgi:hypothetical protein
MVVSFFGSCRFSIAVLLLAAFVVLTAALLEIEAENFCLLAEVTLCGNFYAPISRRTGIRGDK